MTTKRLERRGLMRKPSLGGPGSWDNTAFFTPSTVLAEMRTVDNAIASLAKDVFASDVSDEFRSEFETFVTEWQAFYDENKGVLSRILNSTYAKTLEYRDRYEEWRRRFLVEGGSTNSPDLPSERFGDQALSILKWTGIGVLVTGLGWLAYRHFSNE